MQGLDQQAVAGLQGHVVQVPQIGQPVADVGLSGAPEPWPRRW